MNSRISACGFIFSLFLSRYFSSFSFCLLKIFAIQLWHEIRRSSSFFKLQSKCLLKWSGQQRANKRLKSFMKDAFSAFLSQLHTVTYKLHATFTCVHSIHTRSITASARLTDDHFALTYSVSSLHYSKKPSSSSSASSAVTAPSERKQTHWNVLV